MEFSTKSIHSGYHKDKATGALGVPIYQVSTFDQEELGTHKEYDYARSGNPTRKALEHSIALLENGTHAFAFSSGMAAISSTFCLFGAGDHIIVCEDVYGGTYRVLTKLFSKFGFETSFVDTTDTSNITKEIKSNTKAIYLETPSNPLLKITDLRKAFAIAKKHNLISIVDNTFMTPYLQRPLDLGADIVLHSATKFLGGHSDLIAGVAVTRNDNLARRLGFVQNAYGAILGPQDCYLLIRGLKTLRIRMDYFEQSAFAIAQYLSSQESVKKVYYPGLKTHIGSDIHSEQAQGNGAVVSFELFDADSVMKLVKKIKLAAFAVSLGGVESILSYPFTMSHASMPEMHRRKLGISDTLLRLSVGLEDTQDLIADLEQALET